MCCSDEIQNFYVTYTFITSNLFHEYQGNSIQICGSRMFRREHCVSPSLSPPVSLYISTSAGYTKWRRFVVKPLEKPTVQVYYALQYTTIKYSTDDYSQSCEIADEVPRSDLVDSYSIR